MRACRMCDEFVRVDDIECPFCGAAQSCAPGLRWVLVGALGVVACGPTIDSAEGTGDASSGTSTTTTTIGAEATTSETTTSGGPTTTDVTTGGSDEIGSTSEGSSSASASEAAYGIVDPDGGGPLECDLWAQDCPPRQKCMPFATADDSPWNATRCAPLDPDPANVGDACTVEGSPTSGFDNCGLAEMCWYVDPETNEGTCIGLCEGTAEMPSCAEGTVCIIAYDGVLPLCRAECDPMMSTCPEGQQCAPERDAYVCDPA